MPLPNLINPVLVTVEQIDRAATIQDPEAREPLQTAARRTAFQILAQFRFEPMPGGPGSAATLQTRGEGLVEQAIGYVLFRKADLDSHVDGPFEIQLNDRITQDGHMTNLDYYVVRIQPRGHYGDQNGPSLIKAWFTDRQPVKTR